MPPLSGDGGDRTEGNPFTWLTVTPLQYRRLERWAAGRFDVGEPAPVSGDTEPTPADLDRAALESCVGGGFYPGIEVSRRIKDASLYADLYRLDHSAEKGLRPGDLTARMAVPWQADFFKCEGFWWPAQRPDQVIADQDYESVVAQSQQKDGRDGPSTDALAFPRLRWARGIENHRDMVDNWSKLGYVVPRPDNASVWTETERNLAPRDRQARQVTELDEQPAADATEAYPVSTHREFFRIMQNPDLPTDFRPIARKLADDFFTAARTMLDSDKGLDSELNFFAYDEVTFQTRIDSIYHYLVDQVSVYEPATDGTCRSREDVIERIRQFGPFNRSDGQWLRNIENVRPRTEVTELLTTIWKDEKGGGDARYDHSTIYTELMRSVGLPTADLGSEEYCRDGELLDSAFTVPLLQLVVSEFTEEFLPEILGMTLNLEWESVWLKTVVELFRRYGIDPTFYQLHLAIDDTAEGHGAMAVQAVRRYLADFDGEQLQQQWRRVWVGYVAFRDTGTLGDDLKGKLKQKAEKERYPGTPPDPEAARQAVLEMIVRKKPYGSLDHGGVTGTGMSNDLFDDPGHVLDVSARGRSSSTAIRTTAGPTGVVRDRSTDVQGLHPRRAATLAELDRIPGSGHPGSCPCPRSRPRSGGPAPQQAAAALLVRGSGPGRSAREGPGPRRGAVEARTWTSRCSGPGPPAPARRSRWRGRASRPGCSTPTHPDGGRSARGTARGGWRPPAVLGCVGRVPGSRAPAVQRLPLRLGARRSGLPPGAAGPPRPLVAARPDLFRPHAPRDRHDGRRCPRSVAVDCGAPP